MTLLHDSDIWTHHDPFCKDAFCRIKTIISVSGCLETGIHQHLKFDYVSVFSKNIMAIKVTVLYLKTK